MKVLFKILFFISLIMLSVHPQLKASDVTITVAPVQSSAVKAAQSGGFRPVMGESFLVVFSISYRGEEVPDYPEFTPVGIEVERRFPSANSFSISARGTDKRTVYTYVVTAANSGTAWLKNISVTIDGKVRKVANKSIQIIAEKQKAKDVFLVAEIDHDKVYVGQGFTINYYLYFNRTRVAVDGYRSDKDPSFANIIKRFTHLRNNEPREPIEIDGVPYFRIKQFSLRAFAESPGFVDLGPMTIEIEYRTADYGPRYRKKLTSTREKIAILPLPAGAPNSFTGLVGEHQIEIGQARTRFLVNEPIELTVRVSGPGALEKFTLPSFLEHAELETFDAQSELVLDATQISGTKKFNLTYLARAPLTLPAHDIALSYFDTTTEKYVEMKKTLPEFLIAGGGSAVASAIAAEQNAETAEEAPAAPAPVRDRKEIIKGILAPDFIPLPQLLNHWRTIHIALIAIIFLLLLMGWRAKPKEYRINPEIKSTIASIRKEGFSYSRLHRLLLHLAHGNNEQESIRVLLEKCALPQRSKDYFLYALSVTERDNFGAKGGEAIKFEDQHFKQLVEILKDEDHKKT